MNLLAVCSWSLQPKSSQDLADALGPIRAKGVARVQLHLDPIREGGWALDKTRDLLERSGCSVVSGMMSMAGEDYSTLESIKKTGGIRPESTWRRNLEAARADADIAARLGLGLVTFHAGFLPHDATDPERGVMIQRLRELAVIFAARGVRVALETGQETASTLADVLRDVNSGLAGAQSVGVNFDPANMILYGMGDPIDALRQLARFVRQIHIKDAVAAATPGNWGEEVPVGAGQVRWEAFFEIVRRASLRCHLVIEREAGNDRVGDICLAADRIRPLAARLPWASRD